MILRYPLQSTCLLIVGVGLLYQKGYFRQYLSPEGWQQESYPVNDFSTLPVRMVRNERGEPVRITVDLAGRPAFVQLWKVQVGRVTLVLLDTNVPENPRDIADVTDELYGGDGEMRIHQEIVLGVGGVRALDVLGMRAGVYHMNEGHCAFLGLERVRLLMKENKLSFAEAREVSASSTIFTSHTPVSAGIDVFTRGLMERYFTAYCAETGLAIEGLLDLGRLRPGRQDEPFNMAVLAMRSSDSINGVSRLHGSVSRGMWRDLWPGVPAGELPISHVTNGIHPGSWMSHEMKSLYDRYLGPGWAEEPGDTRIWLRAEEIPGEELWRTHERRRERLVAFARRHMKARLQERGAGQAEVAQVEDVLDPEALTIGFARRFATYKRGTLILREPARLERILNAPGRPVQILFAGKAHPKDEEGKKLIREVVQLSRRPEFRRRIVFLEDYSAVIARALLEGVDVWLNTPRRPMEASGTSGMKAAFNGALNLSIRDGWWDEAYSPRTGWAIGDGGDYRDLDYQDRVEAGTLYELLEREVVPLFYARGADGLPRGWLQLVKTSIADLCPVFNTNRMVFQYTIEAYAPAVSRRARLEEDGFKRARALAAWRGRVRQGWSEVRIARIEADAPEEMRVGASFDVRVWVHPGWLSADDLAVEVCVGRVDENQEIVGATLVPMTQRGGGAGGDGQLLFQGTVQCRTSGMQGFTVRVMPRHEDLAHPHATGLILWAQ